MTAQDNIRETKDEPDDPSSRDISGQSVLELDEHQTLKVTIFPGRPWELETAPLAYDPLQRVPVNATVFSRQDVDDAQLNDVEAILYQTPGVNYSNHFGNGRNGNIFLRGAGSLTPFNGAEGPVGLYVDDVYMPNSASVDYDLFDIERIEILRGPQGTRGGRNTIAGAVRINTVEPALSQSAESTVSVGNYNARYFRGYINTPNEKGSVLNRVSAAYTKRDGTVDNIATGEAINTLDNWGARNQTKLNLGLDREAIVRMDYADYSPVRLAAGPFDTVIDQKVDILDPSEDHRQTYGTSLQFNWFGDEQLVSSITAVRGLHYDTFGSDFSDEDLADRGLDDNQFQLSEELRFESPPEPGTEMDWIAGVFLFGEKLKSKVTQQLNNIAPMFGLPIGYREVSKSKQLAWSGALYGDATWHLTDRFDIFGGVRLTLDRRSIDYSNESSVGSGFIAPDQSVDDTRTFTNVSPRLGLSYNLTPDNSVYGLISRGYQAGGFNSLFVQDQDLAFNDETATNYEIGLKSVLFDDRLVAHLSLFYLDWKDQQVQSLVSQGFPVTNAQRTVSRGIEALFAARPAPGLDLGFGIAYIDAEFDDYKDFPGPTPGTTVNVSGNDVPYSSKVTWNLLGQYRGQITREARLLMRLDYSYRSGFYFDPTNDIRQPSYGLLNARVGLEGDRWGLYLWGKNLADTKYRVNAAIDVVDGLVAIPGDPRTYGIEMKLRF